MQDIFNIVLVIKYVEVSMTYCLKYAVKGTRYARDCSRMTQQVYIAQLFLTTVFENNLLHT